jgi:hypothetical protein
VAALRLHSKDGYQRSYGGQLPIHIAAEFSTVDVLQLLLEKCPELLLEVTEYDDENLLHMALNDANEDRGPVNAKVQLLCDKCPGLLYMENDQNMTPFQYGCCYNVRDLKNLKIMYEADNSIVSERIVSIDGSDDSNNQLLPIELICKFNSDIDNGFSSADSDVIPIFCFLLLCQAPTDTELLYDWAVRRQEPDSIKRLILNYDRTFQPDTRRHLNRKARMEGMFLAFRALSTDLQPSIWIKLRHESIDLLMHTITFL